MSYRKPLSKTVKPDNYVRTINVGTFPMPNENELPSVYADRVGQWYMALISTEHKKNLGQFLTSVEVAKFMARLSNPANRPSLRILDPGAGVGVLSCALCEVLAEQLPGLQEILLDAYEIDRQLALYLEGSLAYAKERLQKYGISLKYSVNTIDFVMTHALTLNDSLSLTHSYHYNLDRFDIVICNPPYFKIPKSDSRAKAAASIVHGQPNIYALFMAISAELLKDDGIFICITPRSYTTGPYFRLFRERFFSIVKPEAIHLFESREEAFSRDAVLQENVILVTRRSIDSAKQDAREGLVRVSSSYGTKDLSQRNIRIVPLTDVLEVSSKHKILRIPVSEEDDYVANLVSSWPERLKSYGLEISTGPVVPFRAVPYITKEFSSSHTLAPLLWMQHVKVMRIEWPTNNRDKEQYIIVNDASKSAVLEDNNYIILRRFSVKEQNRRLTAAPLLAGTLGASFIGIENHLNYIYRPGGSLIKEEAYGLAILLNSCLLDIYFRVSNGNTQISATEIRSMPLPTYEQILELGRRAMVVDNPIDIIDTLVKSVLKTRSLRVISNIPEDELNKETKRLLS